MQTHKKVQKYVGNYLNKCFDKSILQFVSFKSKIETDFSYFCECWVFVIDISSTQSVLWIYMGCSMTKCHTLNPYYNIGCPEVALIKGICPRVLTLGSKYYLINYKLTYPAEWGWYRRGPGQFFARRPCHPLRLTFRCWTLHSLLC